MCLQMTEEEAMCICQILTLCRKVIACNFKKLQNFKLHENWHTPEKVSVPCGIFDSNAAQYCPQLSQQSVLVLPLHGRVRVKAKQEKAADCWTWPHSWQRTLHIILL